MVTVNTEQSPLDRATQPCSQATAQVKELCTKDLFSKCLHPSATTVKNKLSFNPVLSGTVELIVAPVSVTSSHKTSLGCTSGSLGPQ